jgi:protease IV
MTDELPENKPQPWSLSSIARWILLPLVLGIIGSLLIPRPTIGVIYLNDAIYSTSAKDLIQEITTARNSNEIRAVVLVMNSPGGTVTDTESVYREIENLRQSKPVVTVVEGIAASGGYYLACASDYIFAKASSEVGNIGVIGTQPESPAVLENIYSTGPYKMWGMPRDSFSRELEMLKQGFLQAVKLGRGARLKMADEVILRGEIYSGGDALRLGLIDAMGSQSDALKKAAELAAIRNYTVKDMFDIAGLKVKTVEPMGFFLQDKNGAISPYPARAGNYMLYIPGLGDAQ